MPGPARHSAALNSDQFEFEPSDHINWGQLTSDAIQNGFPQGPHASDPSDDGHGPGTADEPRDGLANVVDQGDLFATAEFISDLL